jgi:hypothetical protein
MKLTYLLTGLLVILLTGCSDKKHQAEQAAFFPDQRASAVNRMIDVQTANGARNDGMLYPVHFDGAHLSSLGEKKLSLMLAGATDARTMTIYLVNDGQGDLLDQRKQAVRDYLKDSLAPNQKIEFAEGTNPATVHPSAETIARMSKVESNGEEGGDSSGSMSSSGAASAK